MYGTGRIGEIKNALEQKYKLPIKKISASDKLNALCHAMQTTSTILDNVIATNSPVSRTVKGHCFESYFDHLMQMNGVKCIEVGGDDCVDRIINNYKLQLKTPYMAGTSGDCVQYKTHKTHGAKSESESIDYYHTVNEFADFLVGLISYNPLNIVILSKNELPTIPSSVNHIKSPFEVKWKNPNHKALNAYGRLGITNTIVANQSAASTNPLLPKTESLIGVDADVILNTIINDANFRIWDMSLRGFLREEIFTRTLASSGVKLFPTTGLRAQRADKADHAVPISNGYKFLQMKGVSTNNCDFDALDPIIATETQLTRGRVNDHPTQSRLYLKSDFDYLVLALDPPIVNLCRKRVTGTGGLAWEFYLIKTSQLDSHHVMSHRLKSLQTFTYSKLQQYKVTNWSNYVF